MDALKSFAVFDLDGTLVRWQLYHAIASTSAKLGHFSAGKYEQVRQARMRWKQRVHEDSFTEYEHELVAAYNPTLFGLTFDQYEQAVEQAFQEYKDQVYTFTRDLIVTLKKQGYLLFAISGSQIEIVKKLADYYGFDDCVGTVFERAGNSFTGKVRLASVNKHEIVQSLIKKHSATLAGSYAVGDTEKDISMLEMAEHPLAFNPTKRLFEHAKKAGWRVVIERKNMVYQLEPAHGSFVLV